MCTLKVPPPMVSSLLQDHEAKVNNYWEEVKKGASMVLSLWGMKGAGKSWTANTLLDRLLDCRFPKEEAGKLPLPSFAGMGDGSPWPIFVRYAVFCFPLE